MRLRHPITIAFVVTLATYLAAAADARTPIAMPGSTWGGVRFPSSQELLERNNLIMEGAVEQGVDWFRMAGTGTLNSFGRLEFKVDRERLDYNNKLQLEVGIKLRFPLGQVGTVEVGTKYAFDHRNITDRTEKGAVVFMNWWGAWDLMRR